MPNRPILVIDDDPRFCDLVTGILTHADFQVLSAHDGWSGIELARSAYPAVILLDMVMPGLDGISTCQRLKQDPLLRDIPVIGMTSSNDLKFAERAFRTGAELFLPKPFQTVNLVRVVELVLMSARRGTAFHRRRRHPRLPASVLARCRIRGEAPEVVGHTGNVSLGGVLLYLPEALAPGTVLRLGLNLPKGAVTAHATVTWTTPQPRGDQNCCHGVQLLGFVEDASLMRYRRFLSQVAAGQGAQAYL